LLAPAPPDPELVAMAGLAARLCGGAVAGVQPAVAGGNNRVYRVAAADGRILALKVYPDRADDPRDRLGAEFDGLALLARHGVEDTMRPVAADRAAGAALYGWVDGRAVEEARDDDIDAALTLVGRLAALAGEADAAAFPPAAEACLSAAELERQTAGRLGRLGRAVREADPDLADGSLARFMAERLVPTCVATLEAARAGYRDSGLDFAQPLPAALQTLSPSDFGLHNALRRRDGRLVFLDFEYFGRDDPVKLAADFLLHPGMRLIARQRRRFRSGMEALFAGDGDFARRLDLLLPVYAVRWTLILLNEFLPERWARRAWAHPGLDREQVLRQQLRKAACMLDLAQSANAVYEGIAP